MAEIGAQASVLLNEVKMQDDVGAKADCLKRMMELVLTEQDPASLLPDFVPCLLEFQTDTVPPVRENVAEMIGSICLQHMDYVQVMAPALLALLDDSASGVVQRAITSGSNIFQTVFEQVALQGIDNESVGEDLLECWKWMIRFKEAVYSLAFQPGDDDVQLLALKFLETTLLLFTPNSKSPSSDQQTSEGASEGFQHMMTRIAGGHPVLDASTLEQEANKNLGLLLDQLQSPEASSLSGLVAFAIINSLAGITERRPYMSETILPVLSSLVPDSEHDLGSRADNIIHELKGLSMSILTSKQAGDLPWREQLVASLRSKNLEDTIEQVIKEAETSTSISSVSEIKEPGTPTSIASVSSKTTRPSITPKTGLKPRNSSATATAPPRTASPLRQIRTLSATTSTTAPPRTASPARQARTSSAATSGTAPPRIAPSSTSSTGAPRTASPARRTKTPTATTSATTAPPRTASPARQPRTSSATAPPRTASPARSSSSAASGGAPRRTASPARQTKTSVSTTGTAPPRTASPARQPRTSTSTTTTTTATRPASPLVKLPTKTTGFVPQNGPASGKVVRGPSPARPRSGPVDSAGSKISSSPRAGSGVENPKDSSVIVPFPSTTVKSSVRPALTSLKVSPRPSPSSSPRAAPSSENPKASGVIVPFPSTTVKPSPKPSVTSAKVAPRSASPSVRTAAPRSASPALKSSARSASPTVKTAPRAASPSARATVGSTPRTASGAVASRPASPSPAARKSFAGSPSPSSRVAENKSTQRPTPNGSSTAVSTSSSRPSKPSASTITSTVSSASPAASARSKVASSASSQSLLKAKIGTLIPSARKASAALESPQGLSSGRGEPSLDVSSDSVDVTAGSKSVVQEPPPQRLRIASFKRSNSSGLSAKATEIISPEVVPAQPLTLNSKKRCGWITSQSDEAHIAYHDSEWGIPVYDDKLLFELIVLQGAQAELSWPTILARRNNFRAAFANFDPAVVARFDEKKKLSLIADSSICFPEAKVRGAVDNAALVLKIIEEYGTLSRFLWSYVNHKPVVSQYKLAKQVPVKTPKSEALSKELIRRGFRFVGPTMMYSVMQAAGLVCDHLVTCYKFQETKSAENSPRTADSSLEGERSPEYRISVPGWKAADILEARVGDHELRRASSNASDPVWADLPKIEEDLENKDVEEVEEEAYEAIKCEITAC